MCLNVHSCVCMSVCASTYVCMLVCMCACVFACISACSNENASVHLCAFMCMHVCACPHVCMCIHVQACVAKGGGKEGTSYYNSGMRHCSESSKNYHYICDLFYFFWDSLGYLREIRTHSLK